MQSNAANVLNSENQESECVSSSLLNFANLPSSGNNISLTSSVFTVNENQRIIRENFHFFLLENRIFLLDTYCTVFHCSLKTELRFPFMILFEIEFFKHLKLLDFRKYNIILDNRSYSWSYYP